MGYGFAEFTTNQILAFVLSVAGGGLYWYQLLLLTQRELTIGPEQLLGLGFAIIIAVLSWARFVFTTKSSLK